MKATFFVLAAALVSLSACSHKQTRTTPEADRVSSRAPFLAPTVADDGGTVSGSQGSLGSASSGRGH